MTFIPNIETPPTFDAQSVLDSTDIAGWVAGIGGNGVLSGCAVSWGSGLNLNFASGSVAFGATTVPVSAGNVSVAPGSSGDRKDIVVVNSAASVYIIQGSPSPIGNWQRTSPTFPPVKPSLLNTTVLLAEVYVPSGASVLAASYVTNKAVPLSGTNPAIAALSGEINALSASVSASVASLTASVAAVDIAGRLNPADAVPPFPALEVDLAGMYSYAPASVSASPPYYPLNTISRWRSTYAAPFIVCIVGDSIAEGAFATSPFTQGWAFLVAQQLTRELGFGNYISPGFRGVWISTGTAPYNEWVFSGPSWTQIPITSAADAAPFSQGYQGTQVSDILTWTNPFSNSIVGADIYYIDVSSGGTWSWATNGSSSWGTIPSSFVTGSNTLKSIYQNFSGTPGGSIGKGGTLQLRCALTGGVTPVTAAFAGIVPYYETTSSSNVTTGTAGAGPGVIVHNIGRAGAGLAYYPAGVGSFVRPSSHSTSGKQGMDILDLIQPQLVICGFMNDQLQVSGGPTFVDTTSGASWNSAMSIMASHIASYADLMWLSYYDGTDVDYGGTTNPHSVQQAFRNATKVNLANIGGTLLDVSDAWNTKGFGNTNPYPSTTTGYGPLLYSDLLHPNNNGHQDIAAMMARILRVAS